MVYRRNSHYVIASIDVGMMIEVAPGNDLFTSIHQKIHQGKRVSRLGFSAFWEFTTNNTKRSELEILKALPTLFQLSACFSIGAVI
jgi:hypothetical protein